MLHLLLIVSASVGGILILGESGWFPVGPGGVAVGVYPVYGLSVARYSSAFVECHFPFLSALVGLVAKPSWKSVGVLNIYPSIHWAWAYSLYTGIIVIVWITVRAFVDVLFLDASRRDFFGVA